MVTLAHALTAGLAILAAIGAWWCRGWWTDRKPVTPAAKVEAQAVAVAADVHESAVKAVDAKAAVEFATDAETDINRRLAAKRAGKALALVLCLLPGVARAECIRTGDVVTCTHQDLVDLRAMLVDAERARDVARADTAQATAERDACRARVAVEVPPLVSPYVWAGGGFVAGVVLVAAIVVAVKR